jgi:hypothetical protein
MNEHRGADKPGVNGIGRRACYEKHSALIILVAKESSSTHGAREEQP